MKIEKINNKNCKDCANKADYIIHFKFQFDTINSVYLCESCLDNLQILEKPKKKVKKCQWLYRSDITGKYGITESYYTDEEVKMTIYSNFIRKIPESEIEVEE